MSLLPLLGTSESCSTVSFDAFTKVYYLHSCAAFATFHIVRDLLIKQEVNDISLHDGVEHGINGYLIRCAAKITQCNRVIIPLSADGEIDLLWLVLAADFIFSGEMCSLTFIIFYYSLRNFLLVCRSECTEAYICVCTPESIM